MTTQTILKLSTPLSDHGTFLSVEDTSLSVDGLIHDAIAQLREQGKVFEATQLLSLYSDHEIWISGKPISKGLQIKDIPTSTKTVNGQAINFQELTFVKHHVGGL